MDMMQSQSFTAVDGADRSAKTRSLFASEPGFRPETVTADAEIMPQQMALSLEVLAAAVVASFRANNHISNVMTHISGARWDHIESALRSILDPAVAPVGMSRLEINIVELVCAEGGVTGRILKPYFKSVLDRLLPPVSTAGLLVHLSALHEVAQSSADGNPGSAAATGAVR